jgi:uncharacterized membrane protein YdjX (TVP38/TMEM64 family)
MTHDTIQEAGVSLVTGMLLSLGGAALWPEVIHGLAVLCTGVATAICVFFVTRWLKKTFPENEKH